MKILAPVDFTDVTNSQIRLVKEIALKHKAQVVLFHAVSPPLKALYPETFVGVVNPATLEEIEKELIKTAREKMEGLRDFLSGLDVDLKVEVGDPREKILEIEEKEGIDLVIMGSHSKTLIEKVLVGSTAQKVVRYGTKPVLVVKGKDPNLSGKVLIAYDLSEVSLKALKFGLKLLKPFLPQVYLLHVDQKIELSMVEDLRERLEEDLKKERERHLKEVLSQIQEEGFKGELLLEKGVSPAQVIVDKAKETGADLIVMGSRGLSGLKRVLLGSTSSEVIDRSPIPILIFKEGDR